MIDHIFKEDFDPMIRTIVQKTILEDDPKAMIDLAGIKELLVTMTFKAL